MNAKNRAGRGPAPRIARRAAATGLVLAMAMSAPLAHAEQSGPPGMRAYWLGLLWRGSGWTPQRTAHTDSVQAEHMANIGRMFDAGALLCAGPFLDNTPLRGIFIFGSDSATAAAFSAGDRAIQEKRLRLELRPWYGPAGLADEYKAMKARKDPAADSLVRYQFAFLKQGPRWAPVETPEVKQLQQGHMQHMRSMADSGQLALAGPFLDGHDPAGILVFRGDSAAVARLAARDPKVQSGWLALEFHPWMTGNGILPRTFKIP